jgi:hypothetical protein
MVMWKKVYRSLLYVVYLVVIVFVLFEAVLRIYNPIPVRLKGESIVLPINQEISLKNDFACFDPVIIHSKNSLGFRGPEKPENFDEVESIIAVGGSTTECYFVSDDKVWTKVLQDSLRKTQPGVWVNNAGLNGHSTFGHKILLRDHVSKLKPKKIIFLTGINDIGREDLGDFDKAMLRGNYVTSSKSKVKNVLKTAANNSEVINLIYNVSKALDAKDKHIFIDRVLELNPKDTLLLSDFYIKKRVEEQDNFVKNYTDRVTDLHNMCVENGIEPIFMTQPYLFGIGTDPVTGTDLAKYKLSDNRNGELVWKQLEKYNAALRKYCIDNNLFLIDLANELPKSNKYFYDEMHYTNAGSIRIGQIVARGFTDRRIKKPTLNTF